jgi:sn-glycerol 3-phosphate transport system substrate-binding protein
VLFSISNGYRLDAYHQSVDEGSGFEWGVRPPPHEDGRDGPRLHFSGVSAALLNGTPETQLAAWVFVRWLNEPEQQAQWATGTGYFPTRRSARPRMNDFLAQNPLYDEAFGYLTSVDYNTTPRAIGYAGCQGALAEVLEAVSSDRDLDSEVQAAQVRCTESLGTPGG